MATNLSRHDLTITDRREGNNNNQRRAKDYNGRLEAAIPRRGLSTTDRRVNYIMTKKNYFVAKW